MTPLALLLSIPFIQILAQSGGPLEPIVQQAATAPSGVPVILAALIGISGLCLGVLGSGLYSIGKVTRYRNEKDDAVRLHQESTLARAEAVNEKERLSTDLGNRTMEAQLATRSLVSLQTQLSQAKDGWKSSDAQIEELTNALKEVRAQTDALRGAMGEAERMSSERQSKVIALNSQIEETQARLSESMRSAAERQAALTQSNALISRQRARLAEIGFVASEVQNSLNTMTMHLDSLRTKVLVDPNEPDLTTPALPGALRELPSDPAPRYDAQIPALPPLPMPRIDPAPAKPTVPSDPPIVSQSPALDDTNASAKTGGIDITTFGTRVTSLAQNLERLSSLINRRPTPPVDAAPTWPTPVVPRSTAPAASAPAAVLDGPVSTVSFNAPVAPLSLPQGDMARLQGIKGVGVVYAVRLGQNGITNVGDLASATPDQLDAIIKAPRWRKPNYAEWITQAKRVAATDGKLDVEMPPTSTAALAAA